MADEYKAILDAATSGVDIIYLLIMVIIIGGIFAFFVWIIWFRMQFKHTIVLRQRTKGETDIITISKYRYVKRKGEGEKIQLWSSKEYKPIPPESAKDVTKKGVEYCEGWISDEGEISYIKADNKNYIPRFDTITANDKEFYANSVFEAQRHKKGSLLDWISNNAGLIALIMIFLVIVAFWEEITRPIVSVTGKLEEITKNQADITANLESIIRDRQYIKDEAGGVTNTTAPD